jgi:Tfp pilus assembly protein FimT
MPRKSYWPAAAHSGCLEENSASTTRSARCGQPSKLTALCSPKPCGFRRSGAAGTTLLEIVVVLAIVGVLVAIALPSFQNTFKSVHLSSATSAVTGAIQSTRFKSVVGGCNYQIVFSQSTTTYQLTTQTLSGTPPSCPVTLPFTNVGSSVSWSGTGDDISLLASTTLQFSPNGIVTLSSGGSTPCTTGNNMTPVACLILSNGTATTNTIIVSGVGNVTVTSP